MRQNDAAISSASSIGPTARANLQSTDLVRSAKSLIKSTLAKRSPPLRFFGSRSVPRQACRRGAVGDNAIRDAGAHGDLIVAKKSRAKFDPEAFLAKADGESPSPSTGR